MVPPLKGVAVKLTLELLQIFSSEPTDEILTLGYDDADRVILTRLLGPVAEGEEAITLILYPVPVAVFSGINPLMIRDVPPSS